MNGKPCIRGLPITLWEVYLKLAAKRLTDEQILAEYPDLVREDFAAVREYILAEIKSRTHDPVTGRRFLPKDNLCHAAFYKGRCGHGSIARWNSQTQEFFYWREKCGHIFIDKLCYPTDEAEPWWDTFHPIEEIPNPKFEIPFDDETSEDDPTFTGNAEDLTECDAEMWVRYKIRTGDS